MRQAQHVIEIRTAGPGLTEVTGEVADWVARQDVGEGLLTVFLRRLGFKYGSMDLRFGDPLSLRDALGPVDAPVADTEGELAVPKLAFELGHAGEVGVVDVGSELRGLRLRDLEPELPLCLGEPEPQEAPRSRPPPRGEETAHPFARVSLYQRRDVGLVVVALRHRAEDSKDAAFLAELSFRAARDRHHRQRAASRAPVSPGRPPRATADRSRRS